MLLPMPSTKLIRTERAICLFAETLFSDESGPPPRERVELISEDAASLVSLSTERARLMFQISLFLVVWAAPLFIRRAPGLHRLPLAARVAALEAMERNAMGAALVLAIKAILCMLWYEHPDGAASVGADPQSQPGVRRLPVLSGGVS